MTKLQKCYHESISVQMKRDKMCDRTCFCYVQVQNLSCYGTVFCRIACHKYASPIFYQHVTDKLFSQLGQARIPISRGISYRKLMSGLFGKKCSAIYSWFSSFFIREKLSRSGHPLKESLRLCLKVLEE